MLESPAVRESLLALPAVRMRFAVIAHSEDPVCWDRPQCGESSLTAQVSIKFVLTAADSRKPEPHSCRFQQIGPHSARSQPTASSLRQKLANRVLTAAKASKLHLAVDGLSKRGPHRGQSPQTASSPRRKPANLYSQERHTPTPIETKALGLSPTVSFAQAPGVAWTLGTWPFWPLYTHWRKQAAVGRFRQHCLPPSS